jgi:chaperonin cofactor prefoldin
MIEDVKTADRMLTEVLEEIEILRAEQLADRDTLQFMYRREESLSKKVRVLSDTNEHLNITIRVLSSQLSSALSQMSSLRYPVRADIDLSDDGTDA